MANDASQQAVEELWAGWRAEYEEPWLASVYVPPPIFNTLAQPYPCLVFGESGSGKSALRLMLAAQALQERKLVVTWKPSPPRQHPMEKPIVYWYLHQGLHSCAATLLQEIAQQPTKFEGIARWAQTLIGDFLHLYFQGAWSLHMERLLGEAPAAQPVLQSLRNHTLSMVPDSTDEVQMMSELIAALKPLGFGGIWVMVDGLEPWEEVEAQVKEQFRVFLSTLALFEEPGFVFKFMAPLSLRPILLASGGVLRRRLEPHTLVWTVEELVSILRTRFAPLGISPPPFVEGLLKDKGLQEKIREQGGGETPRGWVRALAPFVRDYVASPHPTTSGTGGHLASRLLPLRLDQVGEQVFIGQRRVETLTLSSYKLLTYLYEQYPRTCTRAELYYRLYKNLDYVPRSSADEGWDKPGDWRSTIDTALSRLRDAIEPEHDTPRYVITVRGKGVRLDNVEREDAVR